MKTSVFLVVAICVFNGSLFSQESTTSRSSESALLASKARFIDGITTDLVESIPNARVAIIFPDNSILNDLIINVLIEKLLDTGRITVIDTNSINLLIPGGSIEEKDISGGSSDSYFHQYAMRSGVDDHTAQLIGKKLGAKIILNGIITYYYRFDTEGYEEACKVILQILDTNTLEVLARVQGSWTWPQ
jgi:hypothetical protein